MGDRERNGRREALGCFRRGEIRGGTQWVATEGQFLRLPSSSVKDWLSRRQETTDQQIKDTRLLLKSRTQALLAEHPSAADISPAVCELLLQEHREPQRKEEQLDDEENDKAIAAAIAQAAREEREDKRKRNTLDYSRFNHIASDSDSDD